MIIPFSDSPHPQKIDASSIETFLWGGAKSETRWCFQDITSKFDLCILFFNRMVQPALTPPKFNIASGKMIVGRRSFPFGSRSLFVGELYVKLPAGIMGNLTAPPPNAKLHQKIRPY